MLGCKGNPVVQWSDGLMVSGNADIDPEEGDGWRGTIGIGLYGEDWLSLEFEAGRLVGVEVTIDRVTNEAEGREQDPGTVTGRLIGDPVSDSMVSG